MDSSETFISNRGCNIECSESQNPQKVSFGRATDIMIRVSTSFLEYQTIILYYHDYVNRSAAKIVFLKKVSVHSIERNANELQRYGIVKARGRSQCVELPAQIVLPTDFRTLSIRTCLANLNIKSRSKFEKVVHSFFHFSPNTHSRLDHTPCT